MSNYLRRAVCPAVCALALLTIAPAASAGQVQYFGTGTANWDYDYSSGTNYWVWNRVWRATPDANGHYHTFALFYSNASSPQAGYQENRFDNPFWVHVGYGYSRAHCADVDPYTQEVVLNVTCQTYV